MGCKLEDKGFQVRKSIFRGPPRLRSLRSWPTPGCALYPPSRLVQNSARCANPFKSLPLSYIPCTTTQSRICPRSCSPERSLSFMSRCKAGWNLCRMSLSYRLAASSHSRCSTASRVHTFSAASFLLLLLRTLRRRSQLLLGRYS